MGIILSHPNYYIESVFNMFMAKTFGSYPYSIKHDGDKVVITFHPKSPKAKDPNARIARLEFTNSEFKILKEHFKLS